MKNKGDNFAIASIILSLSGIACTVLEIIIIILDYFIQPNVVLDYFSITLQWILVTAISITVILAFIFSIVASKNGATKRVYVIFSRVYSIVYFSLFVLGIIILIVMLFLLMVNGPYY